MAAEAEARRVKGTTPSLAPEKYAGTYADSANGEIRAALEDGRPVVRYGTQFTADLDHWHFDTFQARWRNSTNFTQTPVSFELGGDGTVRGLTGEYFGSFSRRP